MAVLAVLLIYFGVYPSPLLNLIRTMMAELNLATQMGPHERKGNGIVPVDAVWSKNSNGLEIASA